MFRDQLLLFSLFNVKIDLYIYLKHQKKKFQTLTADPVLPEILWIFPIPLPAIFHFLLGDLFFLRPTIYLLIKPFLLINDQTAITFHWNQSWKIHRWRILAKDYRKSQE